MTFCTIVVDSFHLTYPRLVTHTPAESRGRSRDRSRVTNIQLLSTGLHVKQAVRLGLTYAVAEWCSVWGGVVRRGWLWRVSALVPSLRPTT